MPAGGAQPNSGRPRKPVDSHPVRFPSIKVAALVLGVDASILKVARSRGCNAFEGAGAVHRERIIKWLAENPQEITPLPPEEPDNFTDNYDLTEETGSVGQTLKSLQADERRLKKRLDSLEANTTLHPIEKGEQVKEARRAWLSVSKTLLQYDIKVSAARREAGELIPLANAVKGVQSLLAWHTIAQGDALRNFIPELEGKNKYQMAAIIDEAIRSAIYRNFKLGVKLNKIPDWMGREAAAFVQGEKPFTLEPVTTPAHSTNAEDY